MRLKYTKIEQYFRAIEYILLIITVFSLIFLRTSVVLISLLVAWLILIFIIACYSYYIFRKIIDNFSVFTLKAKGKIIPGNYFFSIPPTIRFKYLDYPCMVMTSIDGKFNVMVEFICQTFEEIELRITHPKIKLKGKEKCELEQFIVTGEDRNLFKELLSDIEGRIIIENLMQEFEHLYFGKDGALSLVTKYDIVLTESEKIFIIFKKIVKLADIFRKKKIS